MFGVSFGELLVIAVIALVVVGPHKLPAMMRTIGEWLHRLRRLTIEVREQTGIDEILRQEGIHGGLGELRGLLRGEFGSLHRDPYPSTHSVGDPYAEAVTFDPTREYPLEGPDAFGALPDDLVDEAADPTKEQSPEPPPVAANAGEHSRA